MASPAFPKSQHLHNFSQPLLKWTKNPANSHQRGGRPSESSPQRSPQDSDPWQSLVLESAALGSAEDAILISSSDHIVERLEKEEPELKADGYRSKTCIRFRTKNEPADLEQRGTKGKLVNEGAGTKKKLAGVKQGGTRSKLGNEGKQTKHNRVEAEQQDGKCNEGGEFKETLAKTWNLRPRKPMHKSLNVNGELAKAGGEFMQDNKVKLLQATPNRLEAEAEEKQEKKRKFSMELSRQEIEEDILKMNRSKPARRPKKRSKTVQKHLDNCFPGLWLASITPDCYSVSEAHTRG
ncbi:hypothetical protein NMG60_11029197 [Bertholletia excelsa]